MSGHEILLCLCLFGAVNAYYVPPKRQPPAAQSSPSFYPLFYYYNARGVPVFINSYPGYNAPTAPPPTAPPPTPPPVAPRYYPRAHRRGQIEYERQAVPQRQAPPPPPPPPPAPVIEYVEPPTSDCYHFTSTKDYMCNCNFDCNYDCRKEWGCT